MWLKEEGENQMKLGQHIFVLMLSLGATFNVLALEPKAIHKVETIELFVMSGTAIVRLDEKAYPGVKAVLHVVDESDLIKAQLNQMLKQEKLNVESEAKAFLAPYFQDPEFMMQIQRAYLAKMQAKRYQLTSYPSAVINRGVGLVSGDADMNSIVEFVNSRGLKQ